MEEGLGVTPHPAAQMFGGRIVDFIQWHFQPHGLLGELNRIPPLCHVLDFFPLINLVNQFRSVIHQPHGRFARHLGTPQAVVGVDPAFQGERQMEVQQGGWRTGRGGGAFYLRGFFPRRVWA